VFVVSPRTGQTLLVSRNDAGDLANGVSAGDAISDDGNLVLFTSSADNLALGDENGSSDVFLRDLRAGTTALVSHTPLGLPGDGGSLGRGMSGDGRYVVFHSAAGDLTPGDDNAA